MPSVPSRLLMSDKMWQRIHALAVRGVNATTDEEKRRNRVEIVRMLATLERRYGEHQLLLSVRSDYTENLDESMRLQERAYSLSMDSGDQYCALLASTSLVFHFLYWHPNSQLARHWLARARALEGVGGESEREELDGFESEIGELETRPQNGDEASERIPGLRKE